MSGNLLERVLLLGFVLAMLDTRYCNDTINRDGDILIHRLVAVEVVVVEYYFLARDVKAFPRI